MAGKSGKGKNRGKTSNSVPVVAVPVVAAEPEVKVDDSAVPLNGEANGVEQHPEKISPEVEDAVDGNVETANVTEEESKQGEGEADLYPVSVKIQSGEKLELKLSPGDAVIDVRQFLLDAPETCFFTCYDLILHTKDGSVHFLEDYNEISEIADITTGGCSLEMIPALYDDRSIRSHLCRVRDLLSLSTRHTSLSTSLALQHEATQTKTTDVGKVEATEEDSLGFMEDIIGSLHNLVTSSSSSEIKCVESIVFSSFNPPPSHRRLAGDLIYIDVVTLEGNKFCITGTTQTFYVNSSKGDVLDLGLSKQAHEASSLIGLLQKISTKFKKGFRELLERKAAAHPFENVQTLLPPNSWLGLYPIPDHKRDAARAEESLTLSFGSELIGMQRDWNEELQSCREFPHTTLNERILRDRALYKVTCDFVDAARYGAIGVICRCIPPINPTDPECFHMYVHNNIFFSFAVDADLGQILKDDAIDAKLNLGGEHSEESNTVSVLLGKASDTANGISGDSTSQTCGSADKEVKHHPADILVDTQNADNEQATYASANNDLKGTKAYQEADVPGLYNLAMAIIDYRGYRVVAQGIIPGILQGDKTDSLLYGSVDNGKKICWDESFHSKVLQAAKHLHLKEHAVQDASGKVVKLAAPVECKGILGSDDRHYLLDLMRITPRDVNYNGPGSRFCVLRPELVDSFCQAEAAERSVCQPQIEGKLREEPVSHGPLHTDLDVPVEVKAKTGEPCASTPAVGTHDDILLNPNVFTEFKLAGNEEEIAADIACVRKAGSYLTDVVLPKFVQDLFTLEVSPMDGQALTDALHAHGINLRYLGKVANLTRTMPHLWDMCITEIVVRSTKHILKEVMRETPDHNLGTVVSHFVNCFIGHIVLNGKKGSPPCMPLSQKKGIDNHQSPHKHAKGQFRWSHEATARKSQSVYLGLTSEGLWTYIKDFARVKYQFELPEDSQLRVKKIYVVRNLCQKVGVIIAARKYDLDASVPFQTSDILNLQPVVKHAFPVCSEARDLINTGKAQLAEGMLNEAYTLFSEAFSILQQVTGPMHREVANCCRYLAMVLYHAGDMTGALVQQHKELIINERCLGLDHPDTAHSYGNMALFYHGLNQTELALRHMSRMLLLLGLSSGPDHPEVAATFINVAMMYQDIGKMNTALRYLQEALKKNERLLGEEHIQTAVCYHALAIAFNCMGAYKLSVQHEKKTYDILVKQLGEADSRTRDSEDWMNTFKLREKQATALKQKGQAVDPISTQQALDILRARPDLVRAFQAATGNTSAGALTKSINAALVGEALPRGRGVDERAARATSEVRKKAAAKGLRVQPNVTAAQALPQMAQLVNIINSGANPSEPSSNTQASDTQKETSTSSTSNGGASDNQNKVPAEVRDQAPVGLGTGLGSLESRKQKSKSKARS